MSSSFVDGEFVLRVSSVVGKEDSKEVASIPEGALNASATTFFVIYDNVDIVLESNGAGCWKAVWSLVGVKRNR